MAALPGGFRFGTSTAAYQIEGAAAEDGRGPSIWDTFTAEPGRVVDGATGAVACDHYHRVEEDVELMRRLGVEGYRFSIAWPRIQPTGKGAVNQKGLAFYDRLVDTLLDNGIQPMVTLYHWDLPQALEDDGGWLNRATTDHFQEYAAIVGAALADRVEHWIPVNEPNVVTMLGYGNGTHAPGKNLMFEALPVAHHLLLGHGKAAIALRQAGATSVGCANNHAPMWPATDKDADVGATKLFDALWNALFAEPMLFGRYPGRPRARSWTCTPKTATWPRSASRSTSTASTTTTRTRSAWPPRTPSSPGSSSRCSATRRPTSAGPSYPTACVSSSS